MENTLAPIDAALYIIIIHSKGDSFLHIESLFVRTVCIVFGASLSIFLYLTIQFTFVVLESRNWDSERGRKKN